MTSITAERTEDPVLAATILSKVLAQVKGDETAKPFAALQAELKADKTFQSELVAADKLTAIKAAMTKAGLDRAEIPASKKKDAAYVVQALDSLMKAYPDTKAAAKAKVLRDKLAM